MDGYIATLVGKGYKVVLVDQVEDPRFAKGLVKREVTRVITPGTFVDRLDPGKNNYLMSVVPTAAGWGLAFCDVSTGELMATVVHGNDISLVQEEVDRIQPSECIFPGEEGDPCPISGVSTWYVRPARDFDLRAATETLMVQFGVASLEGFGAADMDLAVRAAGGLVSYVKETQMGDVPQVSGMRIYHVNDFMRVDAATRRALDVEGREHSLIKLIDATCTAMGNRQLRAWLERPS